jgi:hypothetical protein
MAAAASALAAAEFNPVRREPAAASRDAAEDGHGSWRIVVKLSPEVLAPGTRAKPAGERVAALAARSKVGLRRMRELSSALQAVEASSSAPGESAASLLARLRADPQVEYAELDQWRYPHALPGDPLNTGSGTCRSRPTHRARSMHSRPGSRPKAARAS